MPFQGYGGPGRRFNVGVQSRPGSSLGFGLNPREAQALRRQQMASRMGLNIVGAENLSEEDIARLGARQQMGALEEQNRVARAMSMRRQQQAESQRAEERERAAAIKMLTQGGKMTPLEAENAFNAGMHKQLYGQQYSQEQAMIREKAAQELRMRQSGELKVVTPPEYHDMVDALAEAGLNPKDIQYRVNQQIKQDQGEVQTRQKEEERLVKEREKEEKEQKRLRERAEAEEKSAREKAQQDIDRRIDSVQERIYDVDDEIAKAGADAAISPNPEAAKRHLEALQNRKKRYESQISDFVSQRPEDPVQVHPDRMGPSQSQPVTQQQAPPPQQNTPQQAMQQALSYIPDEEKVKLIKELANMPWEQRMQVINEYLLRLKEYQQIPDIGTGPNQWQRGIR